MLRLSVLLTALGVQVFPYAAVSVPTPLSGTYEVRICNAPCTGDESDANFVRGTLVLFPEPLQTTDLSILGLAKFRPGRMFGPSNGCFVISRGDLGPRGLTQWRANDRAFSFDLGTSPDSTYLVTASITETGFNGTGGWTAFPPEPPPDVVIGRRIGSADTDRCLHAAKEQDTK